MSEKQHTDLDLAIAQFTGWREAHDSGNLIRLVESMALTKTEWDAIRNHAVIMPGDRMEIDNYFRRIRP